MQSTMTADAIWSDVFKFVCGTMLGWLLKVLAMAQDFRTAQQCAAKNSCGIRLIDTLLSNLRISALVR